MSVLPTLACGCSGTNLGKYSTQLQELSDARAALRVQEEDTSRLKTELEKVNSREKDGKRALEAARTASAEAMRRCLNVCKFQGGKNRFFSRRIDLKSQLT